MNDLNGYKIAQIGGAALFVVMFILTGIGTHSMSTFIFWGILMLVGVGIFLGARKLDEVSRERKRDEELARNRKLKETSRGE